MMNGGENSDSIPMDLIPEILSRLPAKSIARFRFVSKLWESIICSQDFTKLFRTMSSSNPRFLFVVKQSCGWSLFSSPQPQNHYGKSSLVVAADFHTKFPGRYLSYASGLFYFPNSLTSRKTVICNPSTGQYANLAILPYEVRTSYRTRGLLGFDPIGKQFKVLVFSIRDGYESVYILTLGTEKMRWKKIKCPSIYAPNSSGICINGVLYYRAYSEIGCFDVGSEKFKFIDVYPHAYICDFQNLINYKGKLCGSKLEYGHDGGFPLKLFMWVLEDVEKEEWSAYAYTLSAENKVVNVYYDLSVVGVTDSGEIVLANAKAHKQFYVFYFNPETNTLLSVEIQGVREKHEWSLDHRVYCFVNHVEDLNFDVMKRTYAATSIRPPGQSTSTSSRDDRYESFNKFDALSLSEDD